MARSPRCIPRPAVLLVQDILDGRRYPQPVLIRELVETAYDIDAHLGLGPRRAKLLGQVLPEQGRLIPVVSPEVIIVIGSTCRRIEVPVHPSPCGIIKGSRSIVGRKQHVHHRRGRTLESQHAKGALPVTVVGPDVLILENVMPLVHTDPQHHRAQGCSEELPASGYASSLPSHSPREPTAPPA